MLAIDLIETRVASLYHGSGVGGALRIIEHDILEDRTQQKLPTGTREKRVKWITGVSLSRSLQIALTFGDVVFQLDQVRLRQRFRIIPIDYWGHAYEPELTGIGRRHGKYAEAEEFLIGPLTNVMRYVTAIYMTKKQKKWSMKYHSGSEPLLTHPLLKVI